ncbi:MAG: HepT-like ribonuclease domain-containing protein [Ruminococcus sp.]|nr:HepT-like ribonuclease domain-containing protein [Ruminococcus sp.]
MDNIKDNKYYVKKIITDLSFIIKHTNNLTLAELEKNEILIDSVMFRLIQISENSDKLTSEFKLYHCEIPWKAMKGMRNRIVHEYGNVDMSVVYDTITNDIPELLKELETLTE